jgi:hypothetical protein
MVPPVASARTLARPVRTAVPLLFRVSMCVSSEPGAGVEAPVAVAAKAPPAADAGYQVTPHVLRYYETAKS